MVSDIETASDGTTAVQLWEPMRALKPMDPHEERLSRGFLRCRPEKWFPGFPSSWLPVTLALGCEARLTEIRPIAFPPRGCDTTFIGSIDGEEILLAIDDETARGLVEEFVPSAPSEAQKVVLSYLARRLFVSLASSWSGPEASNVRFHADGDPALMKIDGAVKVAFTINTTPCTVWIALGKKWVDTLDGLWRRQIQSSNRGVSATTSSLQIEVAQLGVPPQMLAEYLKPSTVIDLEVRASDSVTLRLGSKPWMPARLVNISGVFGCEIAPGALATPPVTEGTTRLSVSLGSVSITPSDMAELSQNGAVLKTNIPLQERVQLLINEDVVGEARLCVYEGRFAIEVLG